METYIIKQCFCILIATFFTFNCSAKSPTQSVANELPKWELAWSDEFDGESIDLTKWTHMIGDGTDYGEQPGWGNNEQQFYTDDPNNSGIIIDDDSNSVLFIEAKMTNVGESEYTSAKLTTENLFAFRFGRVEARIKLPYSQGIWPAFWMLGSNKPEIGWPGCGEIDIMEMLGGAEDIIYGNIHYVNSDQEHDEDLGFSILGEGKYSDDYHIYSIEWSPRNIKWLIDGEYFHEIEITADMKEFLRSHFLILNIAVGGYWPGYPDETSIFPQRMYVDYIRIYQDTTLIDIPAEPVLDVEEETMGLGSTSALAAINNDFTPFHDIKIVKYGPASPDISVSTVAIDGETSIFAVYSGGNWGGFWLELDSPIDMSEYHNGNLVVMLDVPENIADFEVKLESIGGFGSVNLLDYPSEPVDNNFDKFTIPLADFVALGLHLENLHIPFALWNPKDNEGEYTGGNVLVDNIYFELSDFNLSLPIENMNTGNRYGYIQTAIDEAFSGDEIVLGEGIYYENVNFNGKEVTVRSIYPNDPSVVRATTINGKGQYATVNILGGENVNSVLNGITITNGNNGIYCFDNSSVTVTNCVVTGNKNAGIKLWDNSSLTISNCVISNNAGAGIELYQFQTRHPNIAMITNCTIAGNSQQGIWGGEPTVQNSIIYFNGSERNDIQVQSNLATITYSDVQGGWPGESNGDIDADPLFADSTNGDYHLKSQAGRYDQINGIWIQDDVTSPCIDTGNPDSDWSAELWPHGGRINMGVYGGTPQASMSTSTLGNGAY